MSRRDTWQLRRLLIGVLVCVVSMLVGCRATVEPHPPVYLEVSGSTSMLSLMEALSDVYTERHDYVSIDIKPRGTHLGLEALREGAVDIALVSRELTADEQIELEVTPIAYDGIAILVNARNQVGSLTVEQVEDIFSGKILLWSEIGGEEADIQVVSREDGSGTRDAFEWMVMAGERVTSMAVVIPSSDAVGAYVAENPHTIAYASAVGLPLGVRPLRINGMRPNVQAVAEGRYALIRPFVLVTRESPDSEVRSFVDFAVGPSGQMIVAERYGRAR